MDNREVRDIGCFLMPMSNRTNQLIKIVENT